jgi:hypothetical protein
VVNIIILSKFLIKFDVIAKINPTVTKNEVRIPFIEFEIKN